MAADKRARRKAQEDADKQAAALGSVTAYKRAVESVNARDQQIMVGKAAVESTSLATPAQVGSPDINIGPDGVVEIAQPTPQAVAEIKDAGLRGMSIVAAVEQGRLPRISLESALGTEFERLIEKHPAQVEHIMDIWKKMGIDENLFRAGRDTADQLNEDREAAQRGAEDNRKFKQQMVEVGKVAMGPEAAAQATEDELYAQGLHTKKLSEDLDMAQKRAQLQLTGAQITQENRKIVEEDLNRNIVQVLSNSVYNDSVPFIRMANEIADSLMRNPNDPMQIQQWQQMGVKVNQLSQLSVNKAVELAVSRGYTGDQQTLRTALEAKMKPVLDLFTGDFSVAQVNKTALESVQNSLKLRVNEALPLYSALQAAGLKPAEMPGLLKAIDGNSDLQRRLSDEVKGFSEDWGENRASTHLMNVIRLLRGEESLSYVPADKAPGMVASLAPATVELSKDYNRGKDIDGNMVVNGIGELTLAARQLTPSSSANAFRVAINAVGGKDTRAALIKALSDGSVDKESAQATVQASRAALALSLDNIQLRSKTINRTGGNFQIGFDANNGKYTVIRGTQPRTLIKTIKGGYDVSVPNPQFNLPIPEEMRKLVNAANQALDGIIELGKHDPSTPKGSDLELRGYYGANRPLPSQGEQKKPVNPDQELSKAFEAFDKSVTSALDNLTSGGVSLPPEIKNTAGYQANAPLVSAAAAKHGVPEQLALALVGKESTFDPNAEGPVVKSGSHKGDRAMGLGQVMARTAAKYGVADRSKLNAAEQADLAMQIVADNFKATGNWKDAVSMYFTGVPFAKAVKEGRTDGFNTVLQYVGAIVR
jgi:rRNA maturation endonuclease Nob1